MPTRTCCVCRQESEKAKLIRFVTKEDNGKIALSADVEQVLPGRGAYCHAQLSCLMSKKATNALRHGLFPVKCGVGAKNLQPHQRGLQLTIPQILESLKAAVIENEVKRAVSERHVPLANEIVKEIQGVFEQLETQEKPTIRL